LFATVIVNPAWRRRNDGLLVHDLFGHGFNRVDESGLAGINQLKELLANPPLEVVGEIAKETGNRELLSDLATNEPKK